MSQFFPAPPLKPPLANSFPFNTVVASAAFAVGSGSLDDQQSQNEYLNDAGLPEMALPSAVAVSVWSPPRVPITQLPTVAMPSASVLASPAVTLPLPEVTANLTATPGVGLP